MTKSLIRDPFLATPFRLMDELLRTAGNGSGVTGFAPPLDVHETEDEYVVMVDLPGVKSADVSIEVDEQLLTVAGSRVPVEIGDSQLVERPYGTFVRTLTLPKGIDSDGIVANCVDGVLELHIPKPAEAKPKKIAIGSGSQKQLEE
jgi:HSP20 family protein